MTGGAERDESGDVSLGSFRARLEFLAAELAAQGNFSGNSSGSGGGESQNSAPKLDLRRSDALKLADRVEALKRVERSLLNCKRLGDPELLQARDMECFKTLISIDCGFIKLWPRSLSVFLAFRPIVCLSGWVPGLPSEICVAPLSVIFATAQPACGRHFCFLRHLHQWCLCRRIKNLPVPE